MRILKQLKNMFLYRFCFYQENIPHLPLSTLLFLTSDESQYKFDTNYTHLTIN